MADISQVDFVKLNDAVRQVAAVYNLAQVEITKSYGAGVRLDATDSVKQILVICGQFQLEVDQIPQIFEILLELGYTESAEFFKLIKTKLDARNRPKHPGLTDPKTDKPMNLPPRY